MTTTGAPVNDDGAVRAGGALSYQDNGDGTVTDLNTQLMWEKKSEDGSLHDVSNTYVWSSMEDQTYVLLTSWRLPSSLFFSHMSCVFRSVTVPSPLSW